LPATLSPQLFWPPSRIERERAPEQLRVSQLSQRNDISASFLGPTTHQQHRRNACALDRPVLQVAMVAVFFF
jgi:hypothetical protein